MLVRFRDERRPVPDGAVQAAAVHEVERHGEGPRPLDVVDLEVHVRWDPAGLDRAQVVSYHMGLREHVGDFDGPDSGACG